MYATTSLPKVVLLFVYRLFPQLRSVCTFVPPTIVHAFPPHLKPHLKKEEEGELGAFVL